MRNDFADDIRYVYPENGPKELVVTTTNLEKPWVAVDEALEKVGISRTDIIKTEYSYLHDEENSLEEKYIFLRSAYSEVMREMDKVRLKLDKERVAAIKDEKEKRRMGRILLGDRTDEVGVTHFKVIETMAGDAAVCQYAADRYVILQKIMHQVSELASIL